MKKIKKNPGCPRRESQGLQPGLQPGATQDPGEEGFPRPETPHAGRPRVPDFFDVFDFFRKHQKNQKNLLIFLIFWFLEKNQKMKIKKIQGAPAGRVKGSSQGSSLEPLRIRERRDSHGQKPPTRGDPGSRTFFIFLMFLIFFVFWPFRKNQKNQENFIDFLVFRTQMKKMKKIQGAPAGRVKGSSQGSSLEPLRIRERRDSHGQKPPTRGDPGSRIFFIFFDFFDFFVFLPSKKKSKKSRKF